MTPVAGLTLDDECFYIAPIGAEGSPERLRSDGVFEFIVQKASTELGLTAVRADHISEPGQITLQVIDHILGAKAAVVDLTGLNANVFYELAVRHTARMPVALIADKDCKLPFDIAQMRTIFFDHTDLRSADNCRAAIVNHLSEALRSGLVDSPIATTVDVRSLQSGSIVERNVAELVTSIEEMARMQRSMLSLVEQSRKPDLSAQTANALLDLIRSARGLGFKLRQIATSNEIDVPSGDNRRLMEELVVESEHLEMIVSYLRESLLDDPNSFSRRKFFDRVSDQVE